MKMIGIAAGPHTQGDCMVQFEYCKGILREGQMQNINVTMTEEIPEGLMKKMKTMGIDTSKIKIQKDNTSAQTQAQKLFKKTANAIQFANRMHVQAEKAQIPVSQKAPQPEAHAAL